jgi:histone-lysine N-methyltransferase SETD2
MTLIFYWKEYNIIRAISSEPGGTLCMIIGICLQVLEFLAQKGILTSEHINGGPRCAGVERLGYLNFLMYLALIEEFPI